MSNLELSVEEVYVGVAPVLSEMSQAAALPPTMPRPSDAFGQWSWATRPDLATPTWHEIQAADDLARFAENLALTEGWLRLRLHRRDAVPGNQT